MIPVLVTTTPPHADIVTVRIMMLLTAPVEVLFLSILFVALHTSLYANIHFSFPILQFYKSLLHNVTLSKEVNTLLLQLHQTIGLLLELIRQLFIILSELVRCLLRLESKDHFFPVHPRLLVNENSQVVLIAVDCHDELPLLFVKVEFLALKEV